MITKLKFIWSWLWVFLKPVIVFLLTELGKDLAEAAANAVRKAAGLPEHTTNLERHKIAYNAVVRDMKALGHNVGEEGAKLTDSMINAAIELALQGLKVEE